jgi:hypothetical protein
MRINEITSEHIDKLTPTELTQLLDKLIRCEAAKHSMPGFDSYVPKESINVKDGGQDGGVKCDDTKGSIWIKNKHTLFQNKATDLPATKCGKEIHRSGIFSNKLKQQVEKTLNDGGQYILFMGHNAGAQQFLEARIDAFYNSVKKKYPKYKKEQFNVYDSTKIAAWVNNFIECIILVQGWNGITRIKGLQTITMWGGYEYILRTEFILNDALSERIKGITEELKQEKACIRIIGHSGLGKSRLVYETLKDIDGAFQSIVYYEVDAKEDDIIQFVRDNKGNFDGILVIDNCELHLHNRLKDEITHELSCFKLITIDYNVEEKNSTNGQKYFFLDNTLYQDVVHQILQKKYGGGLLAPKHIEDIARYSDGYPIMAVYFADAKLEGVQDFTKLDSTIKERLVFGRDWEKKEQLQDKYSVIKSCAIFKEFGYPFLDVRKLFGEEEHNYRKEQSKFIYGTLCSPAITPEAFVQACDYFKNKGILERRGRTYSVKPNPLAIKLAEEWWISLFDNSDTLKVILPEIQKVGLTDAFVQRLQYLDQVPEAQDMVGKYFGLKGPFGAAEVLNTDVGSHLFRYVVDVNPKATVETLAFHYLDKSKEELLNVKYGRRNLVWALEKLCFYKETFDTAAKILMGFAVAENEQIGNNSTNQFLQLFHMWLPGTEADLNARIKIIEYAIGKKNDDYIKLAIEAIGRAFKIDYFNRFGTPERRGSGLSLIDYQPKNENEVIDYLLTNLSLLEKLSVDYPQFIEQIKHEISSSQRALLYFNQGDKLKPIIKNIHTAYPEGWEASIDTLNRVLKYEKRLTDKSKEIGKEILELLQPTDLRNKLKLYVALPSWDSAELETGGYKDLAQEKAEKFAAEFSKETIKEIIPHLDVILTGEQRQAFSFGKVLGETVNFDRSIVDAAISTLEKSDLRYHNATFIGGYLFSAKDDIKREIIKVIKEKKSLARHAFYLTRVWLVNLDDVLELFSILEEGNATIDGFDQFLWGNAFKDFSVENITKVCKKIFDFSDLGKCVAISILFQYSSDEKKWPDVEDLIIELLSNHNYLLNQERKKGNYDYNWSECVTKILNASNNEHFAKIISAQIYEALKKDHFISSDYFLKNIARLLSEKYFKIFFDAISPAFVEKTGGAYISVKFLFGADNGHRGILFNSNHNNDIIIDFCRRNPAAARRIAYMMPIYDDDGNGNVKWHPLALIILKEFSLQEGLFEEFSANFNSYFVAGSLIPFYEKQLKLVSLLIDDDTPSLRTWARRKKEFLEAEIEREKIKEKEYQ